MDIKTVNVKLSKTNIAKTTVHCKDIKNKELCSTRKDCMINKSDKCQKKPLTKKIKPSLKVEDVSVIQNSKSATQSIPLSSSIVIQNDLDVFSSDIGLENNPNCTEENRIQINELLKKSRKDYDTNIKECEESEFGYFVQKYFKKKQSTRLTHKELLMGLQKYYQKEKKKDSNYVLSFQDFIHKFSQKTPVGNVNFKRQHVFEALCRLLVYYNYDKGELGQDKHFYHSLENFIKGTTGKINENILESPVNEGSKAGIVDIFFKSKKNNKPDDLWACEDIYDSSKKEDLKDEYIMIQNKYYDKEKSNISNYDVTRIYALADTVRKEKTKFGSVIPKIILMVNNEDAVSYNLNKAKQQYPNLIYKIYGVVSLNMWFQQMMYDLLKTENIDIFIANRDEKKTHKPIMELRFHQKYIVNCSKKYIEHGRSKLIWGAVPRSGKSYMIGGLISDRYTLHKNPNNIVIILGALTETLSQFSKMFNDFADFDKYTIITPGSTKEEGEFNIYLFSQEWLKDKVEVDKINKELQPRSAIFNEKLRKKYPRIFEKNIDLYFDEVHKGGSTDNSESIIHAFNNSQIHIDIFIMVTATFAKPTLRYNSLNFIGSEQGDTNKPEVIEWSYTDQQNMKYITDETKEEQMIYSRNGLQQQVLQETFEYYKEYYGIGYLIALANEYKKHPELVLISPESITIRSSEDSIMPTTDDIRNVFLQNLQCNACKPKEAIEFYQNPANIFKNVKPVDGLLNYISHHIYNYFKSTLKYKIDSPHTELWFLPDKHLYGNDTECKYICRTIKIDENMDEENETNTSIPNIEPLTRGLAIKICKHDAFNRYNVLIIHNTKLTYLGKGINETVLFDKFVSEDGKKRIKMFEKDKTTGLSEQIKEFEKESYLNGKSLIVLTGAKLRLGISLPCADIAFNFDDIKSIDNNYQTMFRVLTERTKPELKEYGYYVDFNKGRSIQFLYEYNKIYGNAKKLGSKEAVESLQSLLFTFNYNGLNLVKSQTTSGIYNKLIKNLKLDENGYVEFFSKRENMIRLIRKSLASTANMRILHELSRVFNTTKSQHKKKIQKFISVEGKLRESMPTIIRSQEEISDLEEEKEQVEKEDDYGELINNISEQLPTIIVLLAMFSNDTHLECSDIKECMEKSLRNILELERQCSCETIDDANILDCFFNSPGLINGEYKYDKDRLTRIIESLITLISEESGEFYDDLNFIYDNIKKVMTTDDGIIYDMNYQDIENKIVDHLSVKEDEKNKHGEVFTPTSLIEEMLDKLPASVWTDNTLKWLDPANGIGNFPMVVYSKLMKGLERWQPDKKKRSNHIIQNMLYMVEINPKNVKISKKIFGSKSNICCSDFLENSEKCFRQFGIDKFDIIIGNPPFQPEKTEADKRQGGHGGKILWDKFVISSLELLVSNGYLCFITPSGWRKPESKLYLLMTKENQLCYLHIIGEKQGHKLFDVSQRIDLYIIKKHKPTKETEIIDEHDNKIKLDVSKWDFIPNYEIDNIKKIMTNEEDGIKIIYDTTYHTQKSIIKQTKTENYKYPIVHSINQDGLVFWYTDDKTKGHFGVPKVLLNFNRHQYPVNDYEGEYGMSQITFGIPITSKKQGDDIVKAINTNEFKEIIKATKWGAFQTDWRMFKYFKPDFYKYFLKGENATKIQSHVRGHNQRKKTQKLKKSIVKLQSVTRGKQQRKKLNLTKSSKKGGGKKTRKNKCKLFKYFM
jgi:hypothetical protein